MKIKVELTSDDLKKLVVQHLQDHINSTIKADDVKIEVKSKQNYKSEWEIADFRATVDKQ